MKIIVLIMMAIALAGCSHSEQYKAEKLIKAYLERNANDPSSVEIIEISKLEADSVLSLIDDVEYQRMKEDVYFYTSHAEALIGYDALDEAESAIASADSINKKVDSLMAVFKPYLRGMKTLVEYRTKNAIGALVKKTAIVKFDNGLTTITEFTDE